MYRFFINRPVFAMVISILTVLVGLVSLFQLPVAQFPNIVPPEVRITTTFTGADAETVEQSVATPIEQQMSGVDNLNYMYSINSSDGSLRLTTNFDVATDPNNDLILSQMRVTQATPQLPTDVANYGVTVQKSLSAPLMLIALYSPHGTYDSTFLANYAYINLNDQLTRVPGMASVTVFGAGQYAMRIWLKPDLLAKLNLTVSDITQALQRAEHGQPGGSDRRRTRPARAGVHLHRPRPGPADFAGGVRADRRARESRRIHGAAEGRGAARTRRAELQHPRPVQRQAGGDHRRLPAAGLERGRRREGRESRNGADEAALSLRSRLRVRPGHNPGRAGRRCGRSRAPSGRRWRS